MPTYSHEYCTHESGLAGVLVICPEWHDHFPVILNDFYHIRKTDTISLGLDHYFGNFLFLKYTLALIFFSTQPACFLLSLAPQDPRYNTSTRYPHYLSMSRSIGIWEL